MLVPKNNIKQENKNTHQKKKPARISKAVKVKKILDDIDEALVKWNMFLPVNQWVLNYQITHDEFFKLMFAIPELAIPFLKKVLPAEVLEQLDLSDLEVQDGILGEKDFFHKSAADLIYVIPYKPKKKEAVAPEKSSEKTTEKTTDSSEKETNSKTTSQKSSLHVSVILEHKSQSDRHTVYQVFRYCGQVMEKEYQEAKDNKTKMSEFKFSPVLPIIIYHGRSKFYGPTKLSKLFQPLPGAEPFMPNLQAILFDLNDLNIDDCFPESNSFALKSVLKMMQSIFKRDVAIRASEALKMLRPYSKNPRYQNIIRTMVIYMARRGTFLEDEEYKQIVKNNKIIDQGDTKMSTVAERMMARGRQEGLEEGLERGREEGREEGLERGREEGELRKQKKNVIKALQIRFGSVPKTIQRLINDRCDMIALESLFETALVVKSLKEFAEEL